MSRRIADLRECPRREGQRPEITFAIVVRNGADALPDLLADLVNQTLRPDRFEVIVVDGSSTDGSRELVYKVLSRHPNLRFVQIDNPRRILSSGWNLAIEAASAPVVVRVDAHARIASDFLERCLHGIAAGHDIVGGPVTTIQGSAESSLLFCIETSRFAGGAAAFRRAGPARHVDTLAYAAYRCRVFAAVGGFDERLVRNQDNEMHHRLQAAGYQFYYDPAIRSHHVMRSSWRAFLRQKFANGYWVAIVSAVQPGYISLRHQVPFGFLLGLAASLALGWLTGFWLLTLAIVGAHGLASLGFTLSCLRAHQGRFRPQLLVAPVGFFITHLAYGAGTLVGILSIPAFRWRNRGYRLPFPVAAPDADRFDPPGVSGPGGMTIHGISKVGTCRCLGALALATSEAVAQDDLQAWQ